jgi:hypothetical protein
VTIPEIVCAKIGKAKIAKRKVKRRGARTQKRKEKLTGIKGINRDTKTESIFCFISPIPVIPVNFLFFAFRAYKNYSKRDSVFRFDLFAGKRLLFVSLNSKMNSLCGNV